MAALKAIIYRIHPAIGFARVGTGSQFFIGPEAPGRGATGKDSGRGEMVPPYKQSPGSLKRQAARFRVWRYTWDDRQNTYVPDADDLTLGAVKRIKWTVELANRKASFFEFHGTNGEHESEVFNPRRRNKPVTTARDTKLEITPGPKSISGVLQGPEKFDVAVPGIPINYLGELQTDDKGRLLVLGGLGKAAPSPSLAAAGGLAHPVPLEQYANNPTWFDDVSDGPVMAEVELNTGEVLSFDDIEPAWVIIGPPDFAPGLRSVVSLFDTLIDVWVRNSSLKVTAASGAPVWMRDMKSDFQATSGFNNFRPDFVRDVFPVLQAAQNTRWVHSPAQPFHSVTWNWAELSDDSAARKPTRQRLFDRLRKPPELTSLTAGANATMPVLIGDEELDEFSDAPETEDGASDRFAPRRPASRQPGSRTWLTLTPVQYSVLRQWMLGKFDKPGWPRSNDPKDLPLPPATITPFGLDQAALENCVGGAFFPGIEVGWLIRKARLYATRGQPSLFRLNQWKRRADGSILTAAGRPLRRTAHYGSTAGGVELTLQAGFFSQQMAIPWQADFLFCLKTDHDGKKDAGWWPAQRPDDVHVTTDPFPLSATKLAAFKPFLGMQGWLDATAASAGPPALPARSGSIDSPERLIEHFQKLGFVRAADAIGESRTNRSVLYLESERDSIPP
jgi:hypothetical protein